MSDGTNNTDLVETITITDVNEAPVLTIADANPASADEDVSQVVAGISLADQDGDTQTVTLSVSNGTLTILITYQVA